MKLEVTNPIVAQFLAENYSAALVRACNILASLEYPIPDRKSLTQQVGTIGKEAECCCDRVAVAVLSLFRPDDFGLDTLQSALEKLHSRWISSRLASDPYGAPRIGPQREPDYIDELPAGPPGRPELVEWGDDLCGKVGTQLWLDAIANAPRFGFAHESEYQVFKANIGDCRRFMPNFPPGRCGNRAREVFAEQIISGESRADSTARARERFEMCSILRRRVSSIDGAR